MDTIETHSSTPARPRRRWRAVALALATTAGALAVNAGDAEAYVSARNVNVFAPEITAAADEAVAGYDAYMASGDLVAYVDVTGLNRSRKRRREAADLGWCDPAGNSDLEADREEAEVGDTRQNSRCNRLAPVGARGQKPTGPLLDRVGRVAEQAALGLRHQHHS